MNDITTAERAAINEAEQEYRIIPKIIPNHALLKLRVIYANGYIHIHNYSDIHSWLFSPTGDKMLLSVSYSPPVVFVGRNLLALQKTIEENKLDKLPVYRRGYHEPINDTEAPIVTAAYHHKVSNGKTDSTEATPEIPDIPNLVDSAA